LALLQGNVGDGKFCPFPHTLQFHSLVNILEYLCKKNFSFLATHWFARRNSTDVGNTHAGYASP